MGAESSKEGADTIHDSTFHDDALAKDRKVLVDEPTDTHHATVVREKDDFEAGSDLEKPVLVKKENCKASSASHPLSIERETEPASVEPATETIKVPLAVATGDIRQQVHDFTTKKRKIESVTIDPGRAKETQPCDMNPATKHSQQQPKVVTDHEAAVQCLIVMKRKFGDGAWPCKATPMNEFILKHVKSASKDDFAIWISQMQKSNFKIANIRKSLLEPLDRMGAVTKVKSRLTWNSQKVNSILQNPQSSGSTTEDPKNASVPVPPSTDPGNAVVFVDTMKQLKSFTSPFPIMPGNEVVAVDCEGVPEELFLVQVGTASVTYVFDCVKLGPKVVCDFLSDMLTDKRITKLFHDLHNDSAAFASFGGLDCLHGTLDTQLAMESLTGELHVGFNRLLQDLGQATHASKHLMKRQMQNEHLFSQRPLPRDFLQYAVDDVRLLLGAHDSLRKRLGTTWNAIQQASDIRARTAAASGGARHICFDVPNSYAIASFELLFVLRPDDMMTPSPLEVSNETGTLLAMLPEDLFDVLNDQARHLSDVVLDKGRRPHAWIGGERLLLGDDNRLVVQEEINAIVNQLGGFGSDNRAGLERQLHRISAIRNRESDIIGLTLRFGRHVSGNTGIISDLLFGDTTKSILFLGEPGAG